MKKRQEKILYFSISIVLALAGGFLAGWFGRQVKGRSDNTVISTLRLSGYKFINPLLACDVETDNNSVMQALSDKLKWFIDGQVSQGKIIKASVYYRNISDGSTINIYENEKYYPASLSKIPVMIAAFKTAQSDSGFLNKKVLWDDKNDYNADQGIKPAHFLEAGKEYTIWEATELMIKYSDNNAFYLLSNNINPDIFKQTFSDLKIPLREDPNSSQDFLTAKDFSYFLRVLYNGTYLNKANSEKALELLSQVDYRDGLVAGVNNNTVVAHKFGLANIDTNNKNRELHDCGIVYKQDKPYLLCIMTKSNSSIEEMQNSIQNISKMIDNN